MGRWISRKRSSIRLARIRCGFDRVEEALLGAPLEQMPERYADASTITHIRAGTTPLVPTLLVYGGRDHIVEPKYGAIVVEALRARGTPVAYLEIPWADHAFDEVFNGPSSQIALYYTERFHREGDSVSRIGNLTEQKQPRDISRKAAIESPRRSSPCFVRTAFRQDARLLCCKRLIRIRHKHGNIPRPNANHAQDLRLLLSADVEHDAIVSRLDSLTVPATEATATATTTAAASSTPTSAAPQACAPEQSDCRSYRAERSLRPVAD